MPVREFDGTDDRIVLDNGALGSGFASGDHTIMLLAKPTTLTGDECYVAVRDAGNLTSMFKSGTLLMWADPDDFIGVGGLGFVTTDYQVFGWGKTAGTTAVRCHRSTLGGAYSHGNSAGTGTGAAGTPTQITVGSNGTAEFIDMRLGILAIWQGVNLSDGDWESVVDATAQIDALNPTVLCEFNQASVGTAVTDLTGGGADQTAITGTTVINGDDPPGWTFGLTPAVEGPKIRVVQSAMRW
jgi:hypothetical protein